MFIARWQINAKFGHKQKLVEMMRKWEKDIGPLVGADKMQVQLSTGSIGALEASVFVDHRVESLAQLEKMFEALGKTPAHQKWGAEIEPYVVSGTSRWEILRVL